MCIRDRHIYNSRSQKTEAPSLDSEEKAAQQAQAREEAAIAETEREQRISQENLETSQSDDSENELVEETETEKGSQDD